MALTSERAADDFCDQQIEKHFADQTARELSGYTVEPEPEPEPVAVPEEAPDEDVGVQQAAGAAIETPMGAVYTVGDKVQVWSRSMVSWLPGEVLELLADGSGEVKVSLVQVGFKGGHVGTKYVEAADPAAIRPAVPAEVASWLKAATTAPEPELVEEMKPEQHNEEQQLLQESGALFFDGGRAPTTTPASAAFFNGQQPALEEEGILEEEEEEEEDLISLADELAEGGEAAAGPASGDELAAVDRREAAVAAVAAAAASRAEVAALDAWLCGWCGCSYAGE